MLHRLRFVVAVALVTPLCVHAQSSAAPETEASPAHSFAPEQLAAIRAIGRNVLAAKKRAAEDPADAEQLDCLRAGLAGALRKHTKSKHAI